MWNRGRLVVFGSLVAAMLASAPTGVHAQKKKDADTPQNSAATEADYAALKPTLFPAKIVTFEPGKSLTVRVDYTKKDSNPNYKPPVTTPGAPGYNPQAAALAKKMADLQAQLQRSVTAKNAAQLQAKINADIAVIQVQLAKLNNDPNNQPFVTVTFSKDFDLTLEKKVAYRKTFLPIENDADGNPKKFTDQEKKALESDDPKNGKYAAKVDEVQEGQEVKLYLTLPKKKAKTDDDPPEHATVKVIVLTKRAPTDADTPKKK
jgi:hypothetical protein